MTHFFIGSLTLCLVLEGVNFADGEARHRKKVHPLILNTNTIKIIRTLSPKINF